jgi:hypothetical protein
MADSDLARRCPFILPIPPAQTSPSPNKSQPPTSTLPAIAPHEPSVPTASWRGGGWSRSRRRWYLAAVLAVAADDDDESVGALRWRPPELQCKESKEEETEEETEEPPQSARKSVSPRKCGSRHHRHCLYLVVHQNPCPDQAKIEPRMAVGTPIATPTVEGASAASLMPVPSPFSVLLYRYYEGFHSCCLHELLVRYGTGTDSCAGVTRSSRTACCCCYLLVWRFA